MSDPYHVCPRDQREAQYDGYGIFLTYTCDACHAQKMRHYRCDIMDHYEADEAIEPEDY